MSQSSPVPARPAISTGGYTTPDGCRLSVDDLGLDNVAIVGHSVGAMEAAAVAASDTTSRITSLVLSATTTPCLTQSDTNPDGVPAARRDCFDRNADAGHPRHVEEYAKVILRHLCV